MAALVNMEHRTFKGMAFAYYEIPVDNKAKFQQMLSTFKFIK